MVTYLLPLPAAAAFLLLSGIDTNGAARAETPVLHSSAAMLRLQMPFGGRSTAVSQTSLTLNFGHRWQSPAGPLEPLELHLTPALQAGWMLSGRPVLRVGAIDASRLFSDRAYAQADADGRGSARFIWIALGAVAVGATALALASSDDDSEYERCPILPPPPPSQPPDCALL
jgi:hypothetical protein